MLRNRLFLLFLLFAVCLSQPALAQINPFRGSRDVPLNAADLAALTEATNRLLDRPQLAAGASENWSNPQSGVSGTATAGNPVQRQGMACRAVIYRATVPGQDTPRSRTLTWCKTKNGWKVA
jgi:surface antigen